MKLVSNCCNTTDIIEPDWEMAEQMGSMWRAYACYICKNCGNVCEAIEIPPKEKIKHKAKPLTKEEVEKGRSNVYKYLDL